ncbi:MAG: RNA methyltransferase [Bacteroidia bacterium]|nr:RNA methyltransferase [Bacteroidia bacterium]
MRKLKMSELNRLSLQEFKDSKKTPLVVILDNVRSLHNVGSVFRTADAFIIEKIYLCGITACPPHKDIQKTALGATDSVDWEYVKTTKDAVLRLKKEGYKIIALEQTVNAILLDNFSPERGEKYVLILGHEVNGVVDEVLQLCDACLEIPQFGTKHSLNISVSAGIAIWEVFKKVSTKSD